jgi:hypothetical protein
VLLLAAWSRLNRTDIFQVNLPTAQRLVPLHGLSLNRSALGNALVLLEDGINGATGTGQGKRSGPQIRTAGQVIQNGFGPGRVLQAFGRVITDLQDALDDEWVGAGRRVFAGTGMSLGNLVEGLACDEF